MRHEYHEGLPVVVLLIVVRVGKLVLEAVGRRLKRAAAGVGRAAERLQLGVGEHDQHMVAGLELVEKLLDLGADVVLGGQLQVPDQAGAEAEGFRAAFAHLSHIQTNHY